MKRLQLHALGRCVAVVALMAPALGGPVSPVGAAPAQYYENPCSDGSQLCPEVNEPLDTFGRYVGHDEPSLLFYSNVPGSGNNYTSQLRLPEESATPPNTAGTGGTYNFQLHPAFWFGMALCDSESSPNPGLKPCPADTDANIADSADPNAPDYIGNHVGSAFVELQFYPPGWVPWPASQIINGGSSCDAKQWCAAILIFALQRNENITDPATGARLLNNADCQARTGVESFNFAFLTRNGKPQGPPSPLFQTTADTFTPHRGQALFMNPGDVIAVDIHDTPDGLRTVLNDLTTDESGSMTASTANGFQQVIFDHGAKTCTSRPYAFHPMYSTASEHTRVTWAAHSYNTAFSDEIGHFEYCPHVHSADGSGALGTFVCDNIPTASDPTGADADDLDGNCAPAALSTLIKIDGCTGTDGEFDSPAYKTVWPGSTTNRAQERRLDPRPIRFTSPVFNDHRDYARVAFEADLPAIEGAQGCSTITQAGCTNPPAGAQFYPIYSTARNLTVGLPDGGDDQAANQAAVGDDRSGCAWQFGGAHIAGTTRTFGGTSATEFSTTAPPLVYPRPTGPVIRFNDYRRVLGNDPCARGEDGGGN
ncbi:MAG TPA: hypothetical protein VKV73_33350 [Chloroflexota bacterium]|nr:hypothetical protein [Chloroflexota bacterium]